MADNKSVFEHLDIIENKIDSNKTPKSISDMIGEPFDAYFDNSTVYYYEPDERKFNRYKVKETKKLIIMIAVYLIPIIIHIILSIVLSVNLPLVYVSDVLLITSVIPYLIYIKKQTNKKLANSKWNLRNHIFYIYENKLGQEDNKGILSTIISTYKWVVYILFLIAPLTMLFKDNSDSIILMFIQSFLGVSLFSIHLSIVNINSYYYPGYIFDNKDSCVINLYNNWEKKLK